MKKSNAEKRHPEESVLTLSRGGSSTRPLCFIHECCCKGGSVTRPYVRRSVFLQSQGLLQHFATAPVEFFAILLCRSAQGEDILEVTSQLVSSDSIGICNAASGAEVVNNVVIPVVTQCILRTFAGYLSADRAVGLGVTLFGTGGFSGHSGIVVATGLLLAPGASTVHIVVIVQLRQGLHIGIATVIALEGLGTGCLAGCFLGGSDGSIGMLAARITCTALSALIGILAEVMGCRNDFLVQGCMAEVAFLVCIVAVCGTGSSLGRNIPPDMLQLSQNHLLYQDFLADRALLACSQTGFVTGSSLGRQRLLSVRQLLEGIMPILMTFFTGVENVAFLRTGSFLLGKDLFLVFSSNIDLIGIGTGSTLIDLYTGSCTGRLLTILVANKFRIVVNAGGRNRIRFISDNITNLALHAGSTAGSAAGSIHTRNYLSLAMSADIAAIFADTVFILMAIALGHATVITFIPVVVTLGMGAGHLADSTLAVGAVLIVVMLAGFTAFAALAVCAAVGMLAGRLVHLASVTLIIGVTSFVSATVLAHRTHTIVKCGLALPHVACRMATETTALCASTITVGSRIGMSVISTFYGSTGIAFSIPRSHLPLETIRMVTVCTTLSTFTIGIIGIVAMVTFPFSSKDGHRQHAENQGQCQKHCENLFHQKVQPPMFIFICSFQICSQLFLIYTAGRPAVYREIELTAGCQC